MIVRHPQANPLDVYRERLAAMTDVQLQHQQECVECLPGAAGLIHLVEEEIEWRRIVPRLTDGGAA